MDNKSIEAVLAETNERLDEATARLNELGRDLGEQINEAARRGRRGRA